jgi:hypothetical protein
MVRLFETSPVCLVDLVCFVYLVDLVHLVSFVQPKNQTDQTNQTDQKDSPDRPNEQDWLVDIVSNLLIHFNMRQIRSSVPSICR